MWRRQKWQKGTSANLWTIWQQPGSKHRKSKMPLIKFNVIAVKQGFHSHYHEFFRKLFPTCVETQKHYVEWKKLDKRVPMVWFIYMMFRKRQNKSRVVEMWAVIFWLGTGAVGRDWLERELGNILEWWECSLSWLGGSYLGIKPSEWYT